MNNNMVERLNNRISAYLDEDLLFNLIENWKTISTRLPKGVESIKDSIIGQIYGSMLRSYCLMKNKNEKDISEEELDYIKEIFELRYKEINEFLEKVFGRYHSY
jgi:hypothetical protein